MNLLTWNFNTLLLVVQFISLVTDTFFGFLVANAAFRTGRRATCKENNVILGCRDIFIGHLEKDDSVI